VTCIAYLFNYRGVGPVLLYGVGCMRKIFTIILALFISVPWVLVGAEREKSLTILFTNDIHSCADNYSRLAYLLRQERAKAAASGSVVITVDAGDVPMGTEYHTLFETEGFDYLVLNRLGYDFYTFGNHDFEGGLNGLSKAFNQYIAALHDPNSYGSVSCCEKRSSLCSDNSHSSCRAENATPMVGGALTFLSSNCDFYKTAWWRSKVPESGKYIKDYALIERQGVKIALLGVMGDDALSATVDGDSLLFAKREVRLRELLEKHIKEAPDYVVLLSHSGSSWVDGKQITEESAGAFLKRRRSEEGRIAANVRGIEAIISGHDHVALHTPFMVNNTVIGSTGSALSYLGKMVFRGKKLVEYKLIPLSAVSGRDSSIASLIHSSAQRISDNFKAVYGLSLQDTVCKAGRAILRSNGEYLGRLIAESYVKETSNLLSSGFSSKESIKFGNLDKLKEMSSLVPFGIIRDDISAGYVTVGDLFRVLPLGFNSNGHSGYPLVLIWVNGGELKDICEINASVASPGSDMRLFFGGAITFSYNRYRIPFTRVFDLKINGKGVKSYKLYPIVTDIYTARLVGLLKSSSFGLLSAKPKNAVGSPIRKLEDYIIMIDGKRELTGWFALTCFLKNSSDCLLSSGERATGTMGEESCNLRHNTFDNSNISPLFLYGSVLALIAAAILFFRKLRL
jgi:5'-nucleotidase / UDP-sugar diphosphatase